MKKLLHIFLVLVMVGCSSDKSYTPTELEDVPILINFATSSSVTKSTDPLPSEEDDSKIDGLIIYIFDSESGALLTTKLASNREIASGATVVSTSVGVRDIYVIANAMDQDYDALMQITSYSELLNTSAELTYFKENSLTMIGSNESITISSENTTSPTIELTKHAARVHLTEIVCDFTDELSFSSFELTGVRLRDVVRLSSYGDTESLVDPQPPYEEYPTYNYYKNSLEYSSGKSLSNSISFSDIESDGVHFYTYANPSDDTITSLLIEGSVNGVESYFAIPLYDIKANNHYSISVTITGGGTDSASYHLLAGSAEIKVTPWNECETNVTF